jgi:hypothetical protein
MLQGPSVSLVRPVLLMFSNLATGFVAVFQQE